MAVIVVLAKDKDGVLLLSRNEYPLTVLVTKDTVKDMNPLKIIYAAIGLCPPATASLSSTNLVALLSPDPIDISPTPPTKKRHALLRAANKILSNT